MPFTALAVVALALSTPPNSRPCPGPVVAVVADTTLQPGDLTLLRKKPSNDFPWFPPEVRAAGGGSVVARFIVDTNGRVMKGTATIVSETNRQLGVSVCRYLSRTEFVLAPVSGRKLTVEVAEQRFNFSVGSAQAR
jgi:hypothetical protein